MTLAKANRTGRRRAAPLFCLLMRTILPSEGRFMAPARQAVQEKRMASKTKAPPQKDETPAKDGETTDSPLLDLSDAAVRKMIKLAKKRGWVSHEQINAVLPSEEVTSDRIEDVFAMLNEMGINVVENEEAEAEPDEEAPQGG